MKSNKAIFWTLILLIVVGALYRIIPGREFGFAPQIAMAVFAGLMIKDRKWGFALPVFSMFISDLIYELLYLRGFSEIRGFYEWQWTNYLLFIGITAFAMLFKSVNLRNFFISSLIAPVIFFLASNFITWITGYGYNRPATFSGLMQCYVDGLPFFWPSVKATLVFGALLFGGFYFLNRKSLTPVAQVN